MNNKNERARAFWFWPDRTHLLHAARMGGLLSVGWCLVFFGTDALTALHSFRVRIHLDGEQRIPFLPWTVLIYQSLYFLFGMVPFVLRTGRQLDALGRTLLFVIFAAGLSFVLLPAESAFPTDEDAGMWTPLVRMSKSLALTHNMVPSLHVALTVTCVAVLAAAAGRLGKSLLWTWAIAVSLSTLLLHQHHLLDVVTGWLLALTAFHGIYRKSLHRQKR